MGGQAMAVSEAAGDSLKTAAIALLLVTAVPFVAGFLLAISLPAGLLFAVFGIPTVYAVLLIASGVLLVRGLGFALDADTWRDRAALVLVGPALLVSGAVAVGAAQAAGRDIGSLARLLLEHDRYEAIIAEVRANPTAEFPAAPNGLRYRVDPGPPVRIAFNPDGMGDNWTGIVFDPTGDVMLADGFDAATVGGFTAPDRVKKLFGGDMVSCTHLWGDFYRCGFT